LISGVGLSLNSSACSAGIFLCIVLYAISKLLIYWFLGMPFTLFICNILPSSSRKGALGTSPSVSQSPQVSGLLSLYTFRVRLRRRDHSRHNRPHFFHP
jgi:hypothetical protein